MPLPTPLAYTQRHKLVTMHGKLFGSLTEGWNMSFRVIPGATATVSQAQADAAFAVAKTWFTSTAANMCSVHSIEWLKVAPIGTNGDYPTGEISYTSTGSAGVGSNTTTNPYPGQCTLVASLMTSAPRGHAWTGRMYPPMPGYLLATDGRISTGNATAFAGSIKTLLDGMNTVADLGLAYVMSPGTIKNPSSAARRVISVRVGTVVDTQRRRRRQLVEQYSSATLA
jgi:hypothetical protein